MEKMLRTLDTLAQYGETIRRESKPADPAPKPEKPEQQKPPEQSEQIVLF